MHTLTAGDLRAVFWPGAGMLCASLQHRGIELLRRIEDLDSARANGSTAGIPFLYPWANRLAGLRYHAAGRDVELDSASPQLHFDEHKLPMHGVPWGQLRWEVTSANQETLSARLEWSSKELLAVFPFPHHVEMNICLRPSDLTFQTTVVAGAKSSVPVSFGFHPYFGIPGIPRPEWRLKLPAMRKLVLDARGIPTGKEKPFAATDGPLGNTSYDDGFALIGERVAFALAGAGYTLGIEFLDGFRFAQVFAPRDKELIALEPMTARTNALTSGQGLQILAHGEKLSATFRVSVEKRD